MLKDRLKMLREMQGLSQSALANKLGLSVGGIGGYENGSRVPKPAILAKLAEFFNVPVEFLAQGGRLGARDYDKFAGRILDALDHTSSDDLEVLGLSEREVRTALRQHAPIREDRAVELASALDVKIDDLLVEAKRPYRDEEDYRASSLARLSAYQQRLLDASEGATPEQIVEAVRYLDYLKKSK